MRDDISYNEIITRLNDMVETVAADCIPNGRKDGKYWRGDLHGKISVHLSGGRVGTVGGWQGQFGGKIGTNLIGLIELAYNCGSHGEAVKVAKERFLGLKQGQMSEQDRERWKKQQEDSRNAADRRKRQEQRDKNWKAGTAQQIWHEAKPIIGTLAEQYLLSREIELEPDMPGLDRWPPSLRFHPALPFRDARHPALIGGVQNVERKLVAIWRIFLGPDGKALTDEEGKKVKLGFGPATGGAVRLGPATPILRITEGMETALGVQRLTKNSASVWAALSTSGMIGLDIPPGVKRLEIYADGDRYRLNKQTGAVDLPPGIKAAEALKAKAAKVGVEAVIFPSPEPDDWLDVWQALKRDQKQRRAVQYQD